MNIFRLQLQTNQISGNADGTGIALSVTDGFKYVDGVKTETVDHLKVSVVFPDNGYEKMAIKVYDTRLSNANEKIAAAGGQLRVKFKNLSGKLYRTNYGEIAVSASADSMEVLQ
ncbi:MAG: hypothetical protein K5868_11360 [Lachnospiraceae bacterium]|nr:hypothetical protein [Lachnospiraceae bacterium]